LTRTNRMPQQELTRMCRYISGLLYYYGVMKLDDLHRRVQLLFDCSPDLAKFRAQLKRKSLDDSTDDAMFEIVRDEIHYLDVEDADWVWREQAVRPHLDFRPVSEEAAMRSGGEDEELLFGPAEQQFCEWLLKKGVKSRSFAVATILDLQTAIRNDVQFTELVKDVQREIGIGTNEELQVLLQHLQDLYNQTHQWILKGWTSQEAFEKLDKPALRPLPNEPFVFPHKVIAEVGRNDTCPCGSGKKYKKCCLGKQH
jgi:hypothetical protein